MITHGKACLVFVTHGRRNRVDRQDDADAIRSRWPSASVSVYPVHTDSWQTVMTVLLDSNFVATTVLQIWRFMQDNYRGYQFVTTDETRTLIVEGLELERQETQLVSTK